MKHEPPEKPMITTHEDLKRLLRESGLKPDDAIDPYRLMLTGKLIRCVDGDTLIAAVGGDRDKNTQIHGVVDAVHWYLQTRGDRPGNLKLIFGRRKRDAAMAEVLGAAAILVGNLKAPVTVSVAVDGEPCRLTAARVPGGRKTSWMKDLITLADETPPGLAAQLSRRVGDAAFRWYRHSDTGWWSGRVEGLQVCSVNADGSQGFLISGLPRGKGPGRHRKVLQAIASGREGPFGQERLAEVADVIKQLAASRKTGDLANYQRHHRLESLALNGALSVKAAGGALKPVCPDHPLAFPVVWTPGGPPRYLSAVMQRGGIPWAIEFKEPAGASRGQGYRHAITRAVLNREFIRRATGLHPWLAGKGLDPARCRAAIAFPKMRHGKRNQQVLAQHKTAANAFGVAVIELPDV